MPCIFQVTNVEAPTDSSVNSFTLCASNGFTKSTFIEVLFGGSDSTIDILSLPKFPEPLHSDVAPRPCSGPHCDTPLIIATVMDTIKFGQRTCPKRKDSSLKTTCHGCCIRQKKPNASVKPVKNARRSGKSR